MATNVIMPQLGESVVEGTISKWLKREGDTVQEFEPLLEVSTDKVDTEVPASTGGVLLKIYVPEGQTVEKGTLLAIIGQPGEVPAANDNGGQAEHGHAPVPAAANGHDKVHAAAVVSEAVEDSNYTGHITPVVARMVTEHGIDLGQIQGTGRGGRVTKKDVEAYLETRGSAPVTAPANPADDLPPWERPGTGDLFKSTVDYEDVGAQQVAPANAPPPNTAAPANLPNPTTSTARVHPVESIPQGMTGELVPLSPMRKAIAEHMVFSKRTSPHVTTVFEIDLSSVLAHREANKDAFAKQGVNLTLTAYFVMAAVEGLRAVPALNARWTDEGVYQIYQYHIGMAVALENGLIVPVIKNAQDLNLLGCARAVNDLASRARSRGLKPDEVQGGTFSITNHGVSGSLFATPIINQPQVGILGIGMMEKRVKVINDMIAIRPCIYASLTFDHRVVDGAGGDAFLLTFKKRLEAFA